MSLGKNTGRKAGKSRNPNANHLQAEGLEADCHHHRVDEEPRCPHTNFTPSVCRLSTALVQWQVVAPYARTEESGSTRVTPHSSRAAEPSSVLSPCMKSISLQEADLFSSNIIKLAALVLVVVSTPPEQLQPTVRAQRGDCIS